MVAADLHSPRSARLTPPRSNSRDGEKSRNVPLRLGRGQAAGACTLPVGSPRCFRHWVACRSTPPNILLRIFGCRRLAHPATPPKRRPLNFRVLHPLSSSRVLSKSLHIRSSQHIPQFNSASEY